MSPLAQGNPAAPMSPLAKLKWLATAQNVRKKRDAALFYRMLYVFYIDKFLIKKITYAVCTNFKQFIDIILYCAIM